MSKPATETRLGLPRSEEVEKPQRGRYRNLLFGEVNCNRVRCSVRL
jgi:hypothetical protein